MRAPTKQPVLSALVGAVVTLLTLGGAPAADARTPESHYATQAVRATNNARAEHDLRELRVSKCLKRFATRQARAMANQEEMYHQDLGPIMAECGLSTAGENVAYGYPTGRAVVWQGWMKSPGHRANILSQGYRQVAVAARRSDAGTWYAAQVFGRKA